MSKNVMIQEGGQGKQLTADKLKTNLVGGGTCLWVPEDETMLGTKIITENGTYNASDDGYYGYEQVIVNIANVGTATGTDGDGDEAVAHTDPETGELVTDKVPSRIEVIEPPTNPYGIYTDGQSISTDGMIVKAYLASGGEYGTVPNSEITISPITANYDTSTDTHPGEATDGTNTLSFVDAGPIRHQHESLYSIIDDYEYNQDPGFIYIGINGTKYLFGPSARMNYTLNRTITNIETGKATEQTYSSQSNLSLSVSTTTGAYFYTDGLGREWRVEAIPAPDNTTNLSIAQIAEILKNGEKHYDQAGSRQTITVSWPRPLDGKVLETTFEILVAPPYSDGSEE